jgi:hypothetical protein
VVQDSGHIGGICGREEILLNRKPAAEDIQPVLDTDGSENKDAKRADVSPTQTRMIMFRGVYKFDINS